MYKLKYYLWCSFLTLIFLILLAAAHFIFGAFHAVFNSILFFLIMSSAHNLFNKQVMFRNMLAVDIAAGTLAIFIVFLLCKMHVFLYTGSKSRGILIMIFLNLLFMYSRYNYKERVSVRKGIY